MRRAGFVMVAAALMLALAAGVALASPAAPRGSSLRRARVGGVVEQNRDKSPGDRGTFSPCCASLPPARIKA